MKFKNDMELKRFDMKKSELTQLMEKEKRARDAFDKDYPDGEEYRETKRCENSCAHLDLINQCCWLITEKTPGLCTDVQEGDYCFHGFKEEY